MVENEVPKKVEEAPEQTAILISGQTPEETQAPLTREELAAKFEQLSVRARAAGMSPLQVLAASYVKRGLAVIDGVLSALEEDSTKKPATETTDVPTKKV